LLRDRHPERVRLAGRDEPRLAPRDLEIVGQRAIVRDLEDDDARRRSLLREREPELRRLPRGHVDRGDLRGARLRARRQHPRERRTSGHEREQTDSIPNHLWKTPLIGWFQRTRVT